MLNTQAVQIDRMRICASLADACELMGIALRFPEDVVLAEGLSSGTLCSDAKDCLADAQFDMARARVTLSNFDAYLGCDTDILQNSLRKGHSILFLAPGEMAAVWPYEAPFRFILRGREGNPSLFRSPVTLDVEKHMRGAGVLPKTSRTEPSDSIWNEFAFLSYLYGREAAALGDEDGDASEQWQDRIRSFVGEHFGIWAPTFMEQVVGRSEGRAYGSEYASIARLGNLVVDAVIEDCA